MAVAVLTEVVIECPRDVVAAYAGDPSNAPSWYANIRSADWQTPPPLGVGCGQTVYYEEPDGRFTYSVSNVEYLFDFTEDANESFRDGGEILLAIETRASTEREGRVVSTVVALETIIIKHLPVSVFGQRSEFAIWMADTAMLVDPTIIAHGPVRTITRTVVSTSEVWADQDEWQSLRRFHVIGDDEVIEIICLRATNNFSESRCRTLLDNLQFN